MKTKRRVKKKKTATKKHMVKNAKNSEYFFVKDGKAIKNIIELSNGLDKMTDDIFKHHVNEMKNDFANWIKDIFKEEKLAKELFKTTDKDKTQIIILRYVINKFK